VSVGTVEDTWVPPPEWPLNVADFVLPKFLDDALTETLNEFVRRSVEVPARQYWTIGQTAHDCEQVVLCFQQMALGTTEEPLQTIQCNGPRFMTFTIEVIRCVPGLDNRGKAPTAQAIENASVTPVMDAEILMDCAKFFDPFMQGVVVTLDVVQADGGMHGVIATYSVNL
jgi:hypothetical protein